ncbi:ammonium transporter [Pimelobacter simplex]|uniref:Ammonium transporter n=4 Tax=Nocardioides simplex TaxID=2045 RepID=A0A0C5XCQ2_NOCSI|nr:ammonium transporter [Pimelobacter simplex]AJR18574.1 Ammonium transporter [Pimelobacter simplex]GEB15853.1 ammonium transporter [Pimelobacter simplex]SFN11852.1 ammonium transporter [Pimelobacter simplex]
MENGYYTWMLVSASLVLLMTAPGLALFYGGMSRTKSVLNMMMMSFSALGVVGIVYALWGWSMSYSTTFATADGATGKEIAKLFSNPFTQFGLENTDPANYVFVAFQLTFAVITAALISGAVADRMKFSAWLVFLPLWVTLSYFPLAHMVWGGGFLSGVENGLADLLFSGDGGAAVAPIDYAGGTVVHINAGVAGLVLALMLGKRIGFGKEPMKPHNLTLTMIGAGLLWFGWFGFNVGSIVNLDAYTTETGLVWLNTTLATCAAMMGWLAVEKLRDGHATSLGAASGVVAGLVAITPACGNLVPWSAMVLGLVAGGLCALAVGLKYKLGYDDSLDVVGVHLVGGLVGTIGVGFLASNDGGLLTGGGPKQLVVQVVVALFAIIWSAIATLVVGLLVKAVIGLRLEDDSEVEGIDFVEHGEAAYDFGAGGGARRTSSLLGTGAPAPAPAPTASEVNA